VITGTPNDKSYGPHDAVTAQMFDKGFDRLWASGRLKSRSEKIESTGRLHNSEVLSTLAGQLGKDSRKDSCLRVGHQRDGMKRVKRNFGKRTFKQFKLVISSSEN
jgi:hypothetical protein